MATYAWQTAKPGSTYSTEKVAERKYGGYDPDQYEYVWDGAYLNRNKKATNPTVLETDAQKQGRLFLSDVLSKPTQTYSADQGVAQNEYAGQIRSQLNDFLNRSNPQSLNLAEQELQRTLTQGAYDPNTSQYYQGVREAADMNLSDALNAYNRGQFLKGNLRSTSSDQGRARLVAQNSANLNQVLGQLAQQERQNQLGAINQSMSLADMLYGQDTGSLNTLTGVSEYLRGLEQAKKDLEYKEFLRTQQQPIDLAQFLYSQPATYVF